MIINQALYRFRRTHGLPNANEQLVNLIVGSNKDHKKVYARLEQFETIKNECKAADMSFAQLQLFCRTIKNNNLTVDDVLGMIGN